MDRYLFGLLDEVTVSRTRRKIESDPQWQLAYEAAVNRKRALADGVRKGAAEAAATRAASPDDVLAAAKAVETRRNRSRKVTYRVLGGLAAAAVLLVAVSWIHIAFIRPPVRTVRLVGQTQWLAGSTVSLRALVTRIGGGREAGVPVTLTVLDPTSDGRVPVVLAEWTTDESGSAAGAVTVPDWASGKTILTVKAGEDRPSTITHPITIHRAARIYLATDKPIYQPGQTLHMRCLALRKPSLRPMAGQPVEFAVIDPAGNIIFSHQEKLSEYGIASADLPTDPLITPGRYNVKVSAGDDSTTQTVEIFHYKLPAFAVKLRFDKPYYLPGQTVNGSVELRYHFSKPVVAGKVDLEITSRVIPGQPAVLHKQTVTTDRSGKASFTCELPLRLFGSQRTSGDAHLLLSARAKDSAGQENIGYATVAVAEQDIRIAAVAENGIDAPGIESRVFIVTSYPDGRPAETIVTVESMGQSLRTDSAGAAVISADTLSDPLRISARDERGRTGRIQISLPSAEGDAMILRTDKPIYSAGQTVAIEVIAPGARQVFLDVVKDRQTMLTRALSIEDGRGRLALDLGGELTGTLQLHAYRLNSRSEWVGRDALIIVRPARQLRVSVEADREVYRPGRDAKITFRVTDASGKGAASALSLAAVDEAVFSVQQAAPGFEHVLLGLDAELLKPAVQAEFSLALLPESDDYARAAFAAAVTRPQRRTAARRIDNPSRPHSLDLDNSGQARTAYRQRVDAAEGTAAGMSVIGGMVLVGLLIALGFITHPKGMAIGSLAVVGGGVVLFLSLVLPLQYSRSMWVNARANQGADPSSLGEGSTFVRRAAARFTLQTDVKPANGDAAIQDTTRVRTYFPETMLWRPQVITDKTGRASLTVPLADSITTWRLSGTAVSRGGSLGTVDSSIRVFQPFFVNVDAPGRLTRGDEVSVPLVLYNYSGGGLEVSLKAKAEARMTILAGDNQRVQLAAGEVKRVYVRVRADEIGQAVLTVHASSGEHADAIRKELRISPPGVPQSTVVNGAITDAPQDVYLTIPGDAVPGSVTVQMKIYPSTFSELLDGLEGIFRMPHGCFEQTSSTTYPNIMALAYMQSHDLGRAEVLAKARRYVQLGYQRLITFEVDGGGFSLYGQSPANVPLTAYGLMEFADMARVHNVDDAILGRTVDWLVRQRKADGSWDGYLPMSHRRVHAPLSATAYVTWGMATYDPNHPQIRPGVDYVTRHIGEARDAHTLALCANALLAVDPKNPAAHRALARLAAMARRDKRGERHWSAADAQMAYCRGSSRDVETTALAALALLHAPEHRRMALDALRWIGARRDPHGTWGTTRSTVLALKALLAGAHAPVKREQEASIDVTWSGRHRDAKPVRLTIRPQASNAVHTLTFASLTEPGPHRLTLTGQQAAGMAYQFVVRYHSLQAAATTRPAGPLAVRVEYDRTTLATNDTVGVRAVVTNNTARAARMLLVDIGTPPGFVVRPGGLEKLKAAGKIDRYTLTSRGVIVYVGLIRAGGTLEIGYDMVALMPLKAVAAPTTVYAYYDPQRRASATPAVFTVR